MTTRLNYFRNGSLATFLISSLISSVFVEFSRADMSDADYQASLKLAQKKVARRNSFNSQLANALSPSLIRNLFGRTYQVGDRWEIAAWSFENTMARMTTDPAHLESKGGHGGIFAYEVTEVRMSPEPGITLKITQLEKFGVKKPDSRVESLLLTLSDRMLQSQKTYRILDRAGVSHAVSVSPDGIHSAITRLELFALDVPELTSAEAQTSTVIPALPPGLQAIATQAGYAKPDVAQSLLYEQDDFFGRGIRAIWQKGDPWPTYLKTSNGVSILIHKGAL